ncbi:uroporphyrinogen-III synthase [Heyndrickxia coagulans]|uniref:uroporphyrinogen-III synthase n=1 Tax=Heyndrickxia coagulans TaxID=1398 RepID=UPI000D73D269|nr:uroporphyrinogen-III synthase [Heyndrickxia coagulans]AWP37493.1 uroporphyrinogen-III synthase [Heyndrickxia coagulans]QDI62993.1 uroporphyrinogen-III synthase [Heyndrickxia coagulans]
MTANGPLSGKNILITRGGKDGEKLAAQIEALGGTPFVVPMVSFRAYADLSASVFLRKLSAYDWVVFTSKNGVRYFLEACSRAGIACEHLNINWAAVGKKTAACMEQSGLKVSFAPRKFTAKDFAREFLRSGHRASRVLLPKGNMAGTEIADFLRKSGIIAEEWIVYETYMPEGAKEKLTRLLRREHIDFALFLSPSAFRHFKGALEESGMDIAGLSTRIAVIGPSTRQAVEKAGSRAAVCPDEYTVEAMLGALCDFVRLEEK